VGNNTEVADEPVEEEMTEEEAATDAGLESDAAEVKSEFFSQEQYDRSLRQLELQASGELDTTVGEGLWEQVLEPEWVDTAEYAKDGPYTFCFSNAGVNNPWR